MNSANRETRPSISGKRTSRSERVSADQTAAEQLRDTAVPGHRDFIRLHTEKTAPAVIGSSFPRSVRRLLSLS